MPSKYQQATGGAYLPSTDVEGEDPARFLDCGGVEFALARIRGIESEELLLAYSDIEARRQSRTRVAKAINDRLDELRADD